MSLYRRFHDRFGTTGLLVAVVALVAALGGTALAAGALTGKQKKEVEKIAKKFAGKPGATGATGPAGAAGANGKDGANGTNGTNGKDGTNGTNGTNGKSVTVSEIPTEEEGCEGRGGAEVEEQGSGSPVEVCNGEEGSPWTAGGVLPSGKTETGVWTFPLIAAESWVFVPISFPIPIASEVEGIDVATAEATCNEEAEPEKAACLAQLAQSCPGLEGGKPRAAAGKLCLYVHSGVKVGTAEETAFVKPFAPTALGVGPSGTLFKFVCKEGSPCIRLGSWAVTS